MCTLIRNIFSLSCFALLTACLPSVNAQWIQQNSGTSSNLYSLSGIDSGNLYAFGFNNILLKTTNAGVNWSQVNNQLSVSGLRVVYFVNNNTGWVGGRGIYKTTNGGINWVNQRVYDSTFSYNCFCFVNNTSGWCSYSKNVWPPEGGVLYTSNGGTNWTVQRNSLDYYQCVQFLNSNTGFISGYAYFYKTSNGGANWSYSSYSGGVRVFFLSPDTGWVANSSIYKTTNGGLNWSYQYGGGSQFSALKFVNNNVGYAVAGTKVFKTTDSGITWAQNFNNSQTLWDICMVDENTGWTAGDGGHIYKTTNGGITSILNHHDTLVYHSCVFRIDPNPFNSTARINFAVGKSGYARLYLCDVRGIRVMTLISKYISEGLYTSIIDAEGLPSGIYFCRLDAPDFSQTKKMVLLK